MSRDMSLWFQVAEGEIRKIAEPILLIIAPTMQRCSRFAAGREDAAVMAAGRGDPRSGLGRVKTCEAAFSRVSP